MGTQYANKTFEKH